MLEFCKMENKARGNGARHLHGGVERSRLVQSPVADAGCFDQRPQVEIRTLLLEEMYDLNIDAWRRREQVLCIPPWDCMPWTLRALEEDQAEAERRLKVIGDLSKALMSAEDQRHPGVRRHKRRVEDLKEMLSDSGVALKILVSQTKGHKVVRHTAHRTVAETEGATSPW